MHPLSHSFRAYAAAINSTQFLGARTEHLLLTEMLAKLNSQR